MMDLWAHVTPHPSPAPAHGRAWTRLPLRLAFHLGQSRTQLGQLCFRSFSALACGRSLLLGRLGLLLGRLGI